MYSYINIKEKANLLYSDLRMRKIILTAISSVFSRILSILVPLLVVRVSLRILGNEIYGLWMTVTSFFTIFAFADLGLGSGLQTKISYLFGSKDMKKIHTYISATFISLMTISLLFILVFGFIFNTINWSIVMNANSVNSNEIVSLIVLAIVMSKIVNIPLGIVQRVQFAFQEGYISNLWNIASSIFSLILVYLISKNEFSPIWIIYGVSFSPLLISFLNYFHFFYIKYPKLKPTITIRIKSEVTEMLKIGIGFMALSILTTIGLTMDSYIIAKTCSLECVTPFSIGYRIASTLSIATTMLSIPLWSANGEAISKRDFNWIKSTTKKMSTLSLAITIFGSMFFIVFGNILIKAWLGYELEISTVMMLGLLFVQIIQSYISPYFMVLNAAGIIKKQVIMFSIFTPMSIILKYFGSLIYGIDIVPWITVITYLLIIVLPTYFIAKNVYSEQN